MKKVFTAVLLTAILFGNCPVMAAEQPDNSAAASEYVNMYRLYNPNSGEHFYTGSPAEMGNLVSVGWQFEGIGWTAPTDGEPVYRLYNPNAGDHHYTTSAGERDMLIRAGWNYENISCYSGGSVPLYREYNPNATSGAHNYTTSKEENDSLISIGWRDEGICWYGLADTYCKNLEEKYPGYGVAFGKAWPEDKGAYYALYVSVYNEGEDGPADTLLGYDVIRISKDATVIWIQPGYDKPEIMTLSLDEYARKCDSLDFVHMDGIRLWNDDEHYPVKQDSRGYVTQFLDGYFS